MSALTLSTHWNACFISPALVYTRFTCDTPGCNEVHGWALSFSFLWWSLSWETGMPDLNASR